MNPIKYLLEKSILVRRVAKWKVLISEYDIVYVSQKAIKGSVLADYLASGPTKEEHAMNNDFLDKEILAFESDTGSDDMRHKLIVVRLKKRMMATLGILTSNNISKRVNIWLGHLTMIKRQSDEGSSDSHYMKASYTSFDSVLLRCVGQYESQSLMKEIHEGTFDTHVIGQVMARKIMRAGYFWSTKEKDCILYARKCHRCQIYADNVQVPPSELNVMAPPWFFSMWGMDVIGPIEPKA
ncbi:uncharacterized protein LOC109794158 [Cajanus cajan]|uniref:uncharacterized protein LOC109794158 n=1 Tax=Cajanus cajan TaxID=3821 RepID=UPI00098D8366|nr:uncharacterized protein LOC109794158 [Cajanus cajan]